MEYRIVEKPSFQIAGKDLRVSTKDGENLRRIPEFWQECVHDGTVDRLMEIASQGAIVGNALLGICTDFAGDMAEFTYIIAAESPGGAPTDGWIEKTIPPATWAVFEAVGAMPDAIQAIWSNIWSDFLPASPYRHGDGPDIEVYPPGDPMQSDYRFEVRIPVVKK